MSATDIVLRLLSIFERLAIPYMLVGSYIRHWTAQHQTAKLFESIYGKTEVSS